MILQENNDADFIFHTNTESGKTDDIQASPDVNLGFLNSYGEWASVSGTASIVTDREKVHKFYSPGLKAWMGDLGDGKHDGGPDDPRIAVIEVKSKSAQYAISRKNVFSAVVEVAKGVVTGETPQVNKLRHIDEQELQKGKCSLDVVNAAAEANDSFYSPLRIALDVSKLTAAGWSRTDRQV